MNLNINKIEFNNLGYLIVKNVFSTQEISCIRENIYKQYEIDEKKGLATQVNNSSMNVKFVKGDLLSKDLLRNILLDDRILNIARKILGNDNIVYFGDSSYQIGTGLRGFHRDNIDRVYSSGPDWQGDYTLIRIGLYLQDHKKYSGGLMIKEGSHKNPDGKIVFVDSEVGDIVLWSLKTIHSGNAVRLKKFKKLSVYTYGRENLIPSFMKKEQQLERSSLFMTFAVKSNHLNRYINEYLLKREDTLEHLNSSTFDATVLDIIKHKKLELFKPIDTYGC